MINKDQIAMFVEEAIAESDLFLVEVKVKPSNVIEISDADTAAKLMRLIEALEDNDDVNNVYANYSIPDEIMAQLDS